MKVVTDVKVVKKSSLVFKDLENPLFYTASTCFTTFMLITEKSKF
jgi:hypothetical protein